MADADLLRKLGEALEPLPTAAGGAALIVASAGAPPALAVLSTGDVFIDGTSIRIALHGGGSVVRRLEGSCSLIVPARSGVLRVEVLPAESRPAGPVDVIEGTVVDIRPTAEPPWIPTLAFTPAPSGDVAPTLEYWRSVREWLTAGAQGDGPAPPR
jgi:hypothetical protein